MYHITINKMSNLPYFTPFFKKEMESLRKNNFVGFSNTF